MGSVYSFFVEIKRFGWFIWDSEKAHIIKLKKVHPKWGRLLLSIPQSFLKFNFRGPFFYFLVYGRPPSPSFHWLAVTFWQSWACFNSQPDLRSCVSASAGTVVVYQSTLITRKKKQNRLKIPPQEVRGENAHKNIFQSWHLLLLLLAQLGRGSLARLIRGAWFK